MDEGSLTYRAGSKSSIGYRPDLPPGSVGLPDRPSARPAEVRNKVCQLKSGIVPDGGRTHRQEPDSTEESSADRRKPISTGSPYKQGVGGSNPPAPTIVALAVGIFALPLFFMHGKKHWLTVVFEGVPNHPENGLLFRLDKNNFSQIIGTIEGQTGLEVERLVED